MVSVTDPPASLGACCSHRHPYRTTYSTILVSDGPMLMTPLHTCLGHTGLNASTTPTLPALAATGVTEERKHPCNQDLIVSLNPFCSKLHHLVADIPNKDGTFAHSLVRYWHLNHLHLATCPSDDGSRKICKRWVEGLSKIN